MITAIAHAQVFDGTRVLPDCTVVVEGRTIVAVGDAAPAQATVVDGRGRTLLPGLIDAHVHTSAESLALALTFGVTTELEMQGTHTRHRRAHLADDDNLADVRSAGFGLTPPGGHPSELFAAADASGGPAVRTSGEGAPDVGEVVMPFVTTPAEAAACVPRLAATGSDYIKFMIDDGTVEGHPGLPMLDQSTVDAGVAAAHRLGMLTVAHALTIDATQTALAAGIDGLAHLFMDQPHTQQIVDAIAAAGTFMVPCIVLDASMMGITGAAFAADPRVSGRLSPAWLATLRGSFNRYPQGNLDDVLASVHELHAAGVDLLTGTDASVPMPALGGLAHGASVHHEVQLLVRAGLTPLEVLRAATSTPARRFGLTDRGRIAPGLRADLLLVDGDPLTTISDTLSVREVWRRGTRMSF